LGGERGVRDGFSSLEFDGASVLNGERVGGEVVAVEVEGSLLNGEILIGGVPGGGGSKSEGASFLIDGDVSVWGVASVVGVGLVGGAGEGEGG
jgi:hypothetical protein